jgi:dTDP-glucose 4,6-dehydratase
MTDLQPAFDRLVSTGAGQRILITGAAGFIGSNLARYILENTGYSVASLDRLDDAGNLERIAELKGRFPARLQSYFHDLRAPIHADFIRGEFKYIAHLAAGSHVDRSVRNPLEFVADNCTGTANLLEWARRHTPKTKLLYFSTDEVVGAAGDSEEFDELSPMNPLNPYAAAKAAGEVLCPAWANTYGLPIAVTRCTNVYGPMQHAEKFIPLCIERIARGEMIQIHAQGARSSTRFYVHVDDVSRAVLTVLEKGGTLGGRGTGRYGISGDQEYSNLDVARRIAHLMDRPLRYELVDFVPNRPRHDMRYAIKSSKLEELGWSPQVSFDDGLADVVSTAQAQAAE